MRRVGRRKVGLVTILWIALAAIAPHVWGDEAPTDEQASPAAHPSMIEVAQIRTSGASLHYAGVITKESVERLRRVLAVSPQVREVVINSTGGDVEAGMAFGDMIHRRGLDVRVSGGLCMSSCANYVFPAGRRKVIEPESLVIWHGSLLQEGLERDFDYSGVEKQLGRPIRWWERLWLRYRVRGWFRKNLHLQDALYRRLGVDATITVIGQQQGCQCNWTLSVADMASFGVRDVVAPDNYAQSGYGDERWDWRLIQRKGMAGDTPPL